MVEFGLECPEARLIKCSRLRRPNWANRGTGLRYSRKNATLAIDSLHSAGDGTRRSLATPTRRCRPRHGRLSDLLQHHGAGIDLPRSRSTPFIRLRGSAPRV